MPASAEMAPCRMCSHCSTLDLRKEICVPAASTASVPAQDGGRNIYSANSSLAASKADQMDCIWLGQCQINTRTSCQVNI